MPAVDAALSIVAELAPGDPVTGAIGAGLFAMLVALYTLFVRSTLAAGKRADERSDAEFARADAELARARADLETMTSDRDNWQRRFIDLLEQRSEEQR